MLLFFVRTLHEEQTFRKELRRERHGLEYKVADLT